MKRFPPADSARETVPDGQGEEHVSSRPRIVSVEKKASGTVNVTVGGSSFLCESSFLALSGMDAADLSVGAALDEEATEALARADEATRALRQASALLARAEQTRFLLAAKLEKKGLGRKAIELALDRLESEGLLSDLRYAQAWLRSKLGKAAPSPTRLALGLRSRGISEEVAKAALAEIFGPEEREASLARAVAKEEKRLASKGLDGRRGKSELKARLRNLGFKPAEIRAFFEARDEQD